MTIDPTFYQNTTSGGFDTFTYSATPSAAYSTATYLAVGTPDGTNVARSQLSFALGAIPAANVYVTESHLALNNYYSTSCTPTAVQLFGLGGPVGASTTWNSAPVLDGKGLVSERTFAHGATGCANAWENFDTTLLARRWMDTSAAAFGMELRAANETATAAYKGFYSGESPYANAAAPALFVTYDHLPDPAVASTPADGAVLATATPTLAVEPGTDPDAGDTLSYWTRITTTPDAETGVHVLDGPWVGERSKQVPDGVLADGVTYYWHTYVYDGIMWRAPGWVRRFTVDLHLGADDPLPTDSLGAARVNLAGGNLVTGVASPSFASVGGPLGVSFAYNSSAPLRHGLTGAYYAQAADTNANHRVDAGEQPTFVRRDPLLSAFWFTGAGFTPASPGPAMGTENFNVRWRGTLTADATGPFSIGAFRDGGVRVTLGTDTVLEDMTDASIWPGTGANPYGTAKTLTAGQDVAITVDYANYTGLGMIELVVKGPGLVDDTIVPASWLAPEAPTLPGGWSLAVGGLGYASAAVFDGSVILTEPSGAAHAFTGTNSGYLPAPGSDATLALSDTGALSLHGDDGFDYSFDAWGAVATATAATDDGSVSSAAYEFSTDATKLRRPTAIVDPVSGRRITLAYAGRDACPTPAPAGFDAAAPADMLCRVSYWDATSTNLWYRGANLARIEDPGGVVSDFAYLAGRLSSARSPLAADAVAAGVAPDDDTARTLITYDSDRRAASVTLPVPNAGTTPAAARPAHTYAYPSDTTTTVTVKASPTDFTSTATFVADGAGRITVGGTDADGLSVGTAVYDAGDRLLVATDAAGRRSSAIHDSDALRAQPTGRVNHTYGPAPAGCFGTDNRPNGTCASPTNTPPHTATTYDSVLGVALDGLAATYWPNRALSAAPVNHGHVVATDGALVTTNPPAGGLGAGNWSARFMGEVSMEETGPYGFAVTVTGRARVFLDDALVVDAWAAHPSETTVSGTFLNALAGRHRIRVDYATAAAAGPALVLGWTPPGAAPPHWAPPPSPPATPSPPRRSATTPPPGPRRAPPRPPTSAWPAAWSPTPPPTGPG